ncbi:MAG: PEP/pyruvate-binding domain-containing protein, partial [Phycisphaerae bacterium]
MNATHLQLLDDCRDKALAGGKAVNLGVLLRAGFDVPGGFCVTTQAYRYWAEHGKGEEIPQDLADAILRTYREMGSPAVAVRSSATAEDMAEASMAGQYETYLDVRDEHALLNRIRCCWASIDSPRTRAYLAQHGIDMAQVAMAVVVQRLVPSDVAGVLFTANPQTGSRDEMLVEASWGLGEAVVSGRVQPDVLRVQRSTGRVLQARIADKQIMIPAVGEPASAGGSRSDGHEIPVHDDKRRIPCLKSQDVHALWKLGLKAADHFGGPQDIEWGFHAGRLYLLQSRPITTLEDAEQYERVLTGARQQLRELSDAGRGPWVVHNLAETLPHPTPLTWSVIGRFMSGAGGFGQMYRQAGFEPSPRVGKDGFLTLVAGKIYMDAALAPEMFFEGYPFKYDVEQLRRNPDAAQAPPGVPVGSAVARMKMLRRAGRAGATIKALSESYDKRLESEAIPAFVKWVAEQKAIELRTLDAAGLVSLWHHREHRVMDDFAPQSLMPSLISGTALAELRVLLEETRWDDDADELTNLLSSAHAADKTLQANALLYKVAQGEETAERWLAEYGHRAPEEFDLATPRWRERPAELLAMARRLKDGASPDQLHREHAKKVEVRLAELNARLAPHDRAELDKRLALARRYMRFREDGKFYLMLGYDLLRDVAVEVGRRLEIGDDVFFLTREEMIDALHIGFAPHNLIAGRKAQYKAEKRVPLPYVIDATNLDELGSPPASQLATGNAQLEAFGISPGVATGPARIVRSPDSAGDLGHRYVLVCPSTDPSWTPLFTNAAGLILECGGTLSHGAVVAREMSIPAVVLRDACTLLKDGQTVTIDGRNGRVTCAAPADGESRDETAPTTVPAAAVPAP